MVSYIYALCFNLLLLFTLNGDTKITFEENEEGSIKSRRINREKIQSSIDKSIYNWGTIYDTICYFLRILNVILKEIKIHEEKKRKNNLKAMFSKLKKMIVTKTEGIALSGPYLFIYELYTLENINTFLN